MATAGADLDTVQRKLQDASTVGDDGMVWTREELLDWYNEGYTQILAMTHATRRFTVLEVPPRFTATGTQNWMARHADGGTFLQWAHEGEGGWIVSSLWQLEVIQQLGTSSSKNVASRNSFTQPHNRSFENNTDAHFRFALPRDNERIVKIWYDNELLIPLATRRLDDLETNWYSIEGEPLVWALGTGRNRTFEVYNIQTAVTDTYKSVDSITNEVEPLHGIIRRIAGDRTYEVVTEDSVPYGIPRRIISDDRQYYARTDAPLRNPLGRGYRLASSEDALLVLDAHVPDRGTLTEEDEPSLIPRQMQKYLRYYTYFRAFNRQGEGYNPNMALFYEQRFARGVEFLRRLNQLSRKDRRMARDAQTRSDRRPRRVQFPSDFPQVLR